MNDNNESNQGYSYGRKILPVGTVVKILEHSKCPGTEGVVEKSDDVPKIFYIACLICHRRGMIPVSGFSMNE